MTMHTALLASTRLSASATRDLLIREVRRGLRRRPRSLPPWMLYDARGSRLFERITQLPEYYPTRTERHILASCCGAMVSAACPDKSSPVRFVELGAGTASKTSILLDAAARLRGAVLYTPVDVSPDALDVACETIAASCEEVAISPIVANYVTDPPHLDAFGGTTVGLYLGSSIGNFTADEASAILRNLRSQLRSRDALLLGMDMLKDEPTLLAAYDDAAGVTAKFNLNMLRRLNRDLGADFDPTAFRHHVLWNRAESRIEMYLESRRAQRVRIPAADLDIQITKGERIHTENSHKFTGATIERLLSDAGFEHQRTWSDDREWYSVVLARVQ